MAAFSLHRFCTAPMLGSTDRHFRNFVRFLSAKTFVYSELVHCHAITRGDYHLELPENAQAHPVALQLAGCEPEDLAQATYSAYINGFDEVNINVGCPSPKGVDGNFGLCLMDEPHLVAECVKACIESSPLPVTVKCRLGSRPDYTQSELLNFLELNMEAGCKCFIVHARKADLALYNTHQNRTLPPLDYEAVYNLKERYSDIEWIINGDIKSVEEVKVHLEHVDGVMMGRGLYHNFYLLAEINRQIFGEELRPLTRRQLLEEKIFPYIAARMEEGLPLSHFVRHILSLYQFQPRANAWRRFLAERAYKPEATLDVLYESLKIVEKEG
ncbi:tRNA dihydrouridine(20/20a) synthase DusA [bacterium]|nr:tRNA dihydrouridine(20/20a) synthase DusA [bacterium]